MANLIIPVLLSFLLGPGVGQLYNREYKKGFILIALSFLVLIGYITVYFRLIRPFLPQDMSTVDPTAMQELLRNAVNQASAQKGYLLSLSQAALLVLWLYGVVDAYRGGLKKMNTGRE